MFFNNCKNLHKIIKFEEINKLKKDISGSIFLLIFFGGTFCGLLYAKLQSALIITIIPSVILIFVIWGIILRLKMDQNLFFLYEGLSSTLTSISCLGISLTIYYSYLSFTSNLFIVILFILYIVLSAFSILLIKSKIEEKSSVKKNKKNSISIIASMGILGVLAGRLLVNNSNQNTSLIILISSMIFVGYTFQLIGNDFILKYIIVKNK